MPSIFPGKPEAKLQAVSVGQWEGKHIITYISGTSIVILAGSNTLLQTIYVPGASSPLRAVSFDPDTGKIAVASGPTVYIYSPHLSPNLFLWLFEYSQDLEDPTDIIDTVSWGRDNELLVGSNSLALFNTFSLCERVWTIPLANRIKFAQFSPDGLLIVTTGTYDRLLKVWRRLGSGPHDQQFEFSYLPHPGQITAIYWRRPLVRGSGYRNVLYTLCSDNKLRIWTHANVNSSPTFLSKWDELDLLVCIQPRIGPPTKRANRRYAFIIDSKDFMLAAERAIKQVGGTDLEQQTIAHLSEVMKYSPEVCIVLDGVGNMSAWGFSNLETDRRASLDIFNIAHVNGFSPRIDESDIEQENNFRFYNFCGSQPDGPFTLLIHQFCGRIEWHECRIDKLLTSAPLEQQFRLKAVWTGHSSAVTKVVRTGSGRAAISRTADNHAVMWTVSGDDLGAVVDQSMMSIGQHVHRIWVLREGQFVVFLHHETISLWDCRMRQARQLATLPYSLQGKPLCLLLIPEATGESRSVHMATISSEMKGISWEIRLPPMNSPLSEDGAGRIIDFQAFDLGSGSDLAYILPVDPAGCVPEVPGVFDSSARDIAFSYTHSGIVKTWSARVNTEKSTIEWFNTATVDTFIENPSLASGTSIRKVSLIDSSRTQLSIWSTRSSQLEYTETFPPEDTINDIDWSWTPDNQSILSVGFAHKVIVYTQLRYDYLDKGPAWAAIKEIDTLGISPSPIGDSVWLTGGRLLVGVGNQVIVEDNLVDTKRVNLAALRLVENEDEKVDMYTLVRRLNGPLPIFHPQFLAQCVLAGKFTLVYTSIWQLYRLLRSPEPYSLADLFSLNIPDCEIWNHSKDMGNQPQNQNREESCHGRTADSKEESTIITEEVAGQIVHILQSVQVGLLSAHEQLHLADIISCMGTVGTNTQSLDTNACRYLLFFRQHTLSLAKSRMPTAMTTPVSWREIRWAFHSETPEILVQLISRHYKNKMTWVNARQSGMFMWLRDMTTLRREFENVAKNEYSKDEDRDPVNCSLYYLALKKKQILLGLWRATYGNKERNATLEFLSNDFNEPRWKSAAAKNAYALLGKRRFRYAAAFFLLAGSLSDAVNILVDKLDDLQLAITIARIWEDGTGPVTRKLILEDALPRAAEEGNRWLATWSFWMLRQRDKALRAIFEPLQNLITLEHSPDTGSKIFLTDDPALAVLYRDLRERSLQALSASLAMECCGGESAFVLQTANMYMRMGCHWLALDLVRNWEYLRFPNETFLGPLDGLSNLLLSTATSAVTSPIRDESGGAGDGDSSQTKGSSVMVSPSQAQRLLRRRSSLVVNDVPDSLMAHDKPISVRKSIFGNDLGRISGKEAVLDEHDDQSSESDREQEKRQPKTTTTSKPAPTMFHEPDPNSLLDAFGF